MRIPLAAFQCWAVVLVGCCVSERTVTEDRASRAYVESEIDNVPTRAVSGIHGRRNTGR